MQARGRSRQVSQAAEARKASEERRFRRKHTVDAVVNEQPAESTARKPEVTVADVNVGDFKVAETVSSAATAATTMRVTSPFCPSTSSMPSASSCDSIPPSLLSDDAYYSDSYCDSPPSPPHTIEDQLHVAYAHDDIHLAKILLLKLQGIEVTSDDDPRIAAVQDEDFDVCFLPHGALLTEEEEQRAKEAQRQAQENYERQLWERRCQSIWECEKQRLREEKERIRMAKVKAEERRKRREQRDQEAQHKVIVARTKKAKLSYGSRASSSSSIVSFAVAPALDMPPRRTKINRPQTPTADQDVPVSHSSVSFEEILSCMDGALFPFSPSERGHSRAGSAKSSITLNHGSRPNPLQILLDSNISHWQPGERRQTRKQIHRPQPCRICTPMSTSSSTSPSVSAISDDSDYSSASLSSFRSTLSDITTPSTSPESVSNMPLRKDISDVNQPTMEPIQCPRISNLCRCKPLVSRLTVVAPDDHPLFVSRPCATYTLPASISPPPRYISPRKRQSPRSTTPFGRLLQLAKGFQNAYMRAMVYSVVPTADYEERSLERPSPKTIRTPIALRPEGYRATAALVSVFTSGLTPRDPLPEGPLISLDGERRTSLPYRLPYVRVFEPDMVPLPSPMQRFFHQSHLKDLRAAVGEPYLDADPEEFATFGRRPYTGTGGPKPRLRIIRNPIWMQWRALQGAVAERGGSLDSPGLKRGPMAMGKEKMLAFTVEWNRRSLLCPEPRRF